MELTVITFIYAFIFVIHHGWISILNRLDTRFLSMNRQKLPDFLNSEMDFKEYQKSVDYNIDTNNFSLLSLLAGIPITWIFILFGFERIDQFARSFGVSEYFTAIIFIGIFGLIQLIINIPFSLYQDFVLEERYEFNRKTLKTFISDFFKSIILGIVLGIPILFALLYIMRAGGHLWWIYAFGIMAVFQLIILWLFPRFIAPFFNKFSPLKGETADSIHELAHRANFQTSGIYTCDGSKRSSHSNAYFTGIGKSKRIVFFDTLMNQLHTQELLGVLGHEIGHYKLGHHKKMLGLGLMISFLFFLLLGILKDHVIIYNSLGFSTPSNYAALIVFSLLAEEFFFPMKYLFNGISRKHEFEADAFGSQLVKDENLLISALKKLHIKNLSSPVVHPLYASYHYSHPHLSERITSLKSSTQSE